MGRGGILAGASHVLNPFEALRLFGVELIKMDAEALIKLAEKLQALETIEGVNITKIEIDDHIFEVRQEGGKYFVINIHWRNPEALKPAGTSGTSGTR